MTLGSLLAKIRGYVEPGMVMHWHGYRAGLDARGGGGDPVGIGDLKRAGVTHVGLPAHHPGDFGHRNYVDDLKRAGFKIVRTLPQHLNAGLNGHDLGELLLRHPYSSDPHRLWRQFVDELHGPCDGFAWNMEHPVSLYPITESDRRLSNTLQFSAMLDVDKDFLPIEHTRFRCQQFAQLFRIYLRLARTKFPECRVGIAYSGYPGARFNNAEIAEAYGCDFGELFRGVTLDGLYYAEATHGMMAWHQGIELPRQSLLRLQELRELNPQARILHNIQLSPLLNGEENYRAQIANRLSLLRPGDGLGMVEFGDRAIWDRDDRWICELVYRERLKQRNSVPFWRRWV